MWPPCIHVYGETSRVAQDSSRKAAYKRCASNLCLADSTLLVPSPPSSLPIPSSYPIEAGQATVTLWRCSTATACYFLLSSAESGATPTHWFSGSQAIDRGGSNTYIPVLSIMQVFGVHAAADKRRRKEKNAFTKIYWLKCMHLEHASIVAACFFRRFLL